MITPVQLQKSLLRFLIASVAVSAAIGIWALAARDFDETGGKTLLTSLTVSGASLLILANGAAITRRGPAPVPLASAALAAVTVPVMIAFYWNDFEPEGLIKTGGSMEIAAIASAYAVLFSTFEPPRRLRAVHLSAYPLAVSVATTLIAMIWGEWTNAGAWRTFGALSIALTAVTISSPLLRRLEGPAQSTAGRRAAYCPNCGSPLQSAEACGQCGARFRVYFRAQG